LRKGKRVEKPNKEAARKKKIDKRKGKKKTEDDYEDYVLEDQKDEKTEFEK
ncbi:hypothetical protein Tco_0083366, partial [Tanacetum coccineum]